MDMEIAVLQSVVANAKDQHQLKAGLIHAIKLIEEGVEYAVELSGLLDEVLDLPVGSLKGDLRDRIHVALAKNPNAGADPDAQGAVSPEDARRSSGRSQPTSRSPSDDPLTEQSPSVIEINAKEALALAQQFDGLQDDTVYAVQRGENGHHGGPGLYAWSLEYPEEGAIFLSDGPAPGHAPKRDSILGVDVGKPGDEVTMYARGYQTPDGEWHIVEFVEVPVDVPRTVQQPEPKA